MNTHELIESASANQPKYWRYADLRQATGLSDSYWRHAVSARLVPHIKVGKAVLFDPEAIKAFLEERTVPGVTK